MKKFVLVIIALLATTVIYAQEFRWGPTASVNMSWLRGVGAGVVSSDCYVGFQAGIKAERDCTDIIAKGFYLDGKFLYTLKGASWSGVHNNLGYLELPVNLGYRFNLSDGVSLMAGLGPYVGLGILGKTVTKVDDTKVKTDIFGQYLKRFDFGLNYNLGVELWNKWQFFVGFDQGLVNIAKTEPGVVASPKYRLKNIYIGTAFLF